MSVESNANFITELNEAYPRKNDLIKEGDDHLRLIKRILKNGLPGFNKAVTITADKLNLLDSKLTVDSQAITVGSSLKMGTGYSFNANGNKVIGVLDPTEDGDAVNLKYLKSLINNITWPVGSLYFSTDSRNPADSFGFGTWEAFGQGRVIIGAGTSSDINNLSQTFSVGGVGGEYTHTLKEAELPPHSHSHNLATASAGEHSHTFNYLEMLRPSPDTKHGGEMAQGSRVNYSTSTAGAHTHTVTGSIGGGGSSVPFTNMQPYVVVAVWKRTK